MTKESDYMEYDGIVQLLASKDWWTWKKFLEKRIEFLSNRVLKLVHEKNYEDASRSEAVIFDIRKQLNAFRDRKGKLEEQFSKQNQ